THVRANHHAALAFQDVIDFFGLGVIVRRCAGARRYPRLGQTLLRDARIAVRKQLADFRSILRREGWNAGDVVDVHQLSLIRDLRARSQTDNAETLPTPSVESS